MDVRFETSEPATIYYTTDGSRPTLVLAALPGDRVPGAGSGVPRDRDDHVPLVLGRHGGQRREGLRPVEERATTTARRRSPSPGSRPSVTTPRRCGSLRADGALSCARRRGPSPTRVGNTAPGTSPGDPDRACGRQTARAAKPSDYFPPLGASVILGSLAATVLTWRDRRLRWWVAAATAVFVACEFLFLAVFFWPRNEIMFVDPVGTHSPEYLRQVAAEFVAGHWVRLAGGAVTAALAFTALLRFVRDTARATGDQAVRAVS
ncbi:chitobiase/beta-hexosaminidase C-terminal domain-containing protein [Micromonospora craniellae]|nr:chitobiase/beta-hexosaminidase C-terminal domain-containing protein [Micromonospora craniellae]